MPKPPSPAALAALVQTGLKHHQAGDLAAAERAYCQVLAVQAQHPDALHLLGVLAHQLGRSDGAVELIGRSLALAPQPQAWFNLGVAYRALKQIPQALQAYQSGLALQPGNAQAVEDLAGLQLEMGLVEDAVAGHRRALALGGTPVSASNLLMALCYDPRVSPLELAAEHRRAGAQIDAAASPRRLPPRAAAADGPPGRALRVGLVSGDLRTHPVGIFLEGMLQHLDRRALELHLYPTQPGGDALTERLRAMGFAWTPLHGLDDDAAAARVRADGIDLLVDLSGHTAHHRLAVFARRPAPVQLTWLGYVATTGLATMDHILCDRQVLPPNDADAFTEQPCYLPHARWCYTPPPDSPAVAPLPALADAGRITFGCFNSLLKLNDEVLRLWARVLLAVPQSRLLLMARQYRHAECRDRVRAVFQAAGVDGTRLVFEPWLPRLDYLRAHDRVDIALDPFPFTGGTTTLEGLWMGVPVVTLKGDRFVARQGESLLRVLGLDDWIADTPDAYVDCARRQAGDRGALAALRAGLRQRLLASPLTDAAGFARLWTEALQGLWQARGRTT